MISKESLILIAVLIILAISFFVWAEQTSHDLQNTIDNEISTIIGG